MFIDIHTHQPELQQGVYRVFAASLLHGALIPTACREGKMGLSLGIHPWEASNWSETNAESLINAFADPLVLMVGEIGLDKRCGIPMSQQVRIFQQQLEAASLVKKPVLLHIVKALPELMAFRELLSTIPACIIHGFRGNANVLKQYLSLGFYVSFGRYHATEVIIQCPLDRLFLESDDVGDVISLYREVAEKRGISMTALQSVIYENFNQLFPTHSID